MSAPRGSSARAVLHIGFLRSRDGHSQIDGDHRFDERKNIVDRIPFNTIFHTLTAKSKNLNRSAISASRKNRNLRIHDNLAKLSEGKKRFPPS